ncbi:MAG: HAMP domain-containing sensor histidine kinase [Planctomycetota bacterium]
MLDESQPVGRPAHSELASQGPSRTGALISLLRLHWFIRLRWGFVAAAAVAMVFEWLLTPETKRPWQLWLLLVVLAVINIFWMGISRFLHSRIEEAEEINEILAARAALVFANAQIAADLLLLTLMIRYSGGVESPMAMFYLFHMAIASLMLRRWQALLQGGWAILLYLMLGLGELTHWVSPHFPLLPSMAGLGLHAIPEFVAAAVAITAGGICGMLYFTQWIAARLDDRERRLRSALEALQLSQAAITDLQHRRSRFMQTAAHQLKTPLAVIQTFAGLIRDEVVQGQAVLDTCKKIIFRCREGIAQVTELLTLARLQEADPAKRPDSITNVGEVVMELCQKYEPLAGGKKVELTHRISPNLDLNAQVARGDLCDCLGNLIDNAIKFTPGPGTVRVSVGRSTDPEPLAYKTGLESAGIDASPGGDYVFVTVTDTGMGIDPKTLRSDAGGGGEGTIFDAFRRGNSALAAGIPGTGLGLSIVLEVVEQAGGRIHVHSVVGRGSSFTLMFPTHRENTTRSHTIRNTRASHVVIETD